MGLGGCEGKRSRYEMIRNSQTHFNYQTVRNLLSLRVFLNQTKQKLTLSLSLHGLGISPSHTVTYNHRYQPEAERE